MFSYNIFKIPGEVMVSVCDCDILGKSLGSSGFEVKKDFYGGKKCTGEGLREILGKATIINAVGKKTIDFLIKEKVIDKKKIIIIDGVPHAQVITL